MTLRGLFVLLASWAWVLRSACGMEGPPPILNPYQTTSSSGTWALQINPSDLLGRGPADYRMERDGSVAWTNHLPFTLWEAVVADDGRVAGYAYTHGWRGFSEAGYRAGMGDFIVVVLSRSGAIVRQHQHVRERSGFLDTPPNPLALGLRLEQRKTRFSVRTADPDLNRDREKWTTYSLHDGRELDTTWKPRGPWPARPASTEVPFAWSNLTLEARSVTPLAVTTGVPPALRALHGFAFGEAGEIAALRWEPPARPALVVVDEEGTVRHEISLPFSALTNWPETAGPEYVGGGRFVVALSECAISGRVEIAWADAATGVATSRAVDRPSIHALAGFADGRFAALTVERRGSSMVDDLHLLASDGEPLWSLHNDAGYGGRPDELLSPEDIACSESNQLVLLDNIRHSLQFFADRGRFVRSVDFDDVWPYRPNYPTDLAPDRESGFILFDFNASQTLVRVDADGRILTSSRPRHPDGTPFRVCDGIKRSPQGDLWTCDGHGLLRLNESGLVNRVLGGPLRSSALDKPGHVSVDTQGRFYVADQRTHALHVFGANGDALGVAQPDPTDLKDYSAVAAVTVAPDGRFFVNFGHENGRTAFDARFRRIGPVNVAVEPIGQSWHFAPTGEVCWISTYHDVFLVQGLTQVVRTISRRADGRWLEYPTSISHASDGSAAILCRNQSNEWSVVVCDSDGSPRSDIPLPASWRWPTRHVFDGKHVFVRWGDVVHLFTRTGQPVGRWPLPAGATWDGPFLDMQQGELMFLDRKGWLVRRFYGP